MTMRYAHLAPDHLETALRYNPLATMKPFDVVVAENFLQGKNVSTRHHKVRCKRVTQNMGNSYFQFLSVMDKTSIVLPRGQLTHVLRHTFAAHFMNL
jgi:hypothetical protein